MDIKNTLIDIIENGIWEINHDYGKIKRTDIVRLSKMVEDIPEDAEQGNNGKCVCPAGVGICGFGNPDTKKCSYPGR